jgi:RND family efflux transporter MFP subunit
VIPLLVVIAFLAGCGSKEEPAKTVVSAAPGKTIQASVVEVKPTTVPIRVEVTGQVAAIFQATLSSRIQGTIDKLLVREGAKVSKGQVLIRLDSRDLEADVARADADVENAKAHLDRMDRLYTQDAVSKQEMENATRAYRVAEASHKAAEARLSYTVVRAPFDGVITEKKVEAGELASPGQPLLRMEDPRRLRLEATVAEGDLKAVSTGDSVPVIVDALGGDVLTGKISQILPAGDPRTHTFMVKVDVPDTPGLKSGMFGRLQLDKGAMRTILVPSAAIVERGELTSLYAVGTDQVARLRWVKLGRRFGNQVEILSGLNEGERVLTDGGRGVDGAAVQSVETVALPPGTVP